MNYTDGKKRQRLEELAQSIYTAVEQKNHDQLIAILEKYADERIVEELENLLTITEAIEDESEDVHEIVYVSDIVQAITNLTK